MQIARALMTAADEALDQIGEHEHEEQLRARMRTSNAREKRQQVQQLKKREALIGNTIAPGVAVGPYMAKVMRYEPARSLGLV